MPVTTHIDGEHFFVKEISKQPHPFVALIVIEVMDVVFAPR
jgi:predicted tellurium resistance membrane protein TerC